MKKLIYKKRIILCNSFFPFSVLDLKTQINYISISLNNKYRTIYLSNKIIYFPSFLVLYLFSDKKESAAISSKGITDKMKYFYVTYKLFVEVIGTGYKLFSRDKFLYFALGYSHLLKIKLPVACITDVGNNHKSLALIYENKYALGNIFYILQSSKQIDRYKGKGVKNRLLQLKLKLNKLRIMKK